MRQCLDVYPADDSCTGPVGAKRWSPLVLFALHSAHLCIVAQRHSPGTNPSKSPAAVSYFCWLSSQYTEGTASDLLHSRLEKWAVDVYIQVHLALQLLSGVLELYYCLCVCVVLPSAITCLRNHVSFVSQSNVKSFKVENSQNHDRKAGDVQSFPKVLEYISIYFFTFGSEIRRNMRQ